MTGARWNVESDWPDCVSLFDDCGWPDWGRRFVAQTNVQLDGCWLWTGRPGSGGYAQIRADGRRPVSHRLLWEYVHGPVPAGLVLDHLCRNRVCVNPAHLEAVTQQENVARSPIALAARLAARSHCDHGHEFTPESTYWTQRTDRPRPTRFCRTCHLTRAAERRAARRTCYCGRPINSRDAVACAEHDGDHAVQVTS